MQEKQHNNTQKIITVERAIDELRRQQGLIIRENNGFSLGYVPAECLNAQTYNALNHSAQLLITAARAKHIGMSDHAVKIHTASLSFAQMMALADPTADQSCLPVIATTPATTTDEMALRLAKYASLLPALMLAPNAPKEWQSLDAEDITYYIAHPELDMTETASAHLPLATAEHTRIISFRSCHATAIHLALIIGEPKPDTPPLTRIHSSCVTGDILGSLRCDCGDQLTLAIEQIGKQGSGLLIYLHQEGRGIGITNKLRAYMLQERGMDTFEANLALGFDEDERNFAIAASILKKLGHPSIRMLTNNPQKIAAMQASGITITERVPLVAPSGRHNHNYLETKAKKSGHLL